MKLQLTTVELQPDKYGKHIKISKVKLLDDNGKYIKFIKLDEKVLDKLKDLTIDI